MTLAAPCSMPAARRPTARLPLPGTRDPKAGFMTTSAALMSTIDAMTYTIESITSANPSMARAIDSFMPTSQLTSMQSSGPFARVSESKRRASHLTSPQSSRPFTSTIASIASVHASIARLSQVTRAQPLACCPSRQPRATPSKQITGISGRGEGGTQACTLSRNDHAHQPLALDIECHLASFVSHRGDVFRQLCSRALIQKRTPCRVPIFRGL